MGEPAAMRAVRAAERTNEAAQAALMETQYSGDSYTYRSLHPTTAFIPGSGRQAYFPIALMG